MKGTGKTVWELNFPFQKFIPVNLEEGKIISCYFFPLHPSQKEKEKKQNDKTLTPRGLSKTFSKSQKPMREKDREREGGKNVIIGKAMTNGATIGSAEPKIDGSSCDVKG